MKTLFLAPMMSLLAMAADDDASVGANTDAGNASQLPGAASSVDPATGVVAGASSGGTGVAPASITDIDSAVAALVTAQENIATLTSELSDLQSKVAALQSTAAAGPGAATDPDAASFTARFVRLETVLGKWFDKELASYDAALAGNPTAGTAPGTSA